ncbi:hypothetical protein [Providencia stuartii]|uniref:hypothetical protein n=1 Tax=Providencia stuartii TaxID=588 RepID=UPI0015D5A60F|nr:hypothetical protein [Providencia stuartii]
MFKHELGQVVQVTISGEQGHVKARAEYMINHDIKWYSLQSRLIDDATQAAYKRGAF